VNVQPYILETLRQRLALPYEDVSRLVERAAASYDLSSIWGIGASVTSWQQRDTAVVVNPNNTVFNSDLATQGWWLVDVTITWTGAAALEIIHYQIDRPPNVGIAIVQSFVNTGFQYRFTEVRPFSVGAGQVGSFQTLCNGVFVGSVSILNRFKLLTTF